VSLLGFIAFTKIQEKMTGVPAIKRKSGQAILDQIREIVSA